MYGVALDSVRQLQIIHGIAEVCPDPHFICCPTRPDPTRPDPTQKFYIQVCYPYPIGRHFFYYQLQIKTDKYIDFIVTQFY
jgi:hypothetical protein